MIEKLQLKTNVKLGTLATHLKFVGGIVPNENGRLPRTDTGEIVIVDGISRLKKLSPIELNATQFSYFPGLNEDDVSEVISRLKAIGLEIQFILMVGGADPMNPEDEDAVADMLLAGVETAKKHNISICSSTSIEEWMQEGATPKEGSDYQAAIEQNVKLHSRVFSEGGIADSCIKEWHIEFLRSIEFQTFTNLQKAWDIVEAMDEGVGQKFFKVLIDTAHCGDSDLSMEENIEIIHAIGKTDQLGIFHASSPTTRGCLSTDDGWISALLRACAETGKLEYVLVEAFHHEDEALAPLRERVEGHGIDTTDGRTYDELMLDGVVDIARRINNLSARNIL